MRQSGKFLIVPPDLRRDGPTVAFVDDINEYYRNDNTNMMIRALLEANIPIISTCQTGPDEYAFFEEKSGKMDSKILEALKKVDIPPLTSGDIQSFPIEIQQLIEQNAEYDGTMGSVFMELGKVRRRYQDLERKGKKGDQDARMILLLIKTIKALYLSGNIEAQGTYSLDKIITYASKLIEKAVSRRRKIPGRKADKKAILDAELDYLDGHFDRLLSQLESDDHNMNFIHWRTRDVIEIESVYLDRIFVPDYGIDQIRADIFEFYPNFIERRRLGYFSRLASYTTLIRKAHNLKTGKALLAEMIDAGLKPNEIAYSSLIKIAKLEQNEDDLFQYLLGLSVSDNFSNPAFIGAILQLLSHSNHTALSIHIDTLKSIRLDYRSQIIGKLIDVGADEAGEILLDTLHTDSFSYQFNKGKLLRKKSLEESWYCFTRAIEFAPNKRLKAYAMNEKARLVSEYGLSGNKYWTEARKMTLACISSFPQHLCHYPAFNYILLGIQAANNETLIIRLQEDRTKIDELTRINYTKQVGKYLLPLIKDPVKREIVGEIFRQ